jgi:nitrite reductase (NO-forming) / hydroxylamine reductase
MTKGIYKIKFALIGAFAAAVTVSAVYSSSRPSVGSFALAEKSAKSLYVANCSKCHRKDGAGIKGVYPPLKNSDYVAKNSTIELIRGMLFGRSGKLVVNGSTYNGVMTTEIDKSLSDEDISSILNYVFKELNASERASTSKDVKTARKAGKL